MTHSRPRKVGPLRVGLAILLACTALWIILASRASPVRTIAATPAAGDGQAASTPAALRPIPVVGPETDVPKSATNVLSPGGRPPLRIEGRAIDAATGAPVRDARVFVTAALDPNCNASATVRTSDAGEFTLEIPEVPAGAVLSALASG